MSAKFDENEQIGGRGYEARKAPLNPSSDPLRDLEEIDDYVDESIGRANTKGPTYNQNFVRNSLGMTFGEKFDDKQKDSQMPMSARNRFSNLAQRTSNLKRTGFGEEEKDSDSDEEVFGSNPFQTTPSRSSLPHEMRAPLKTPNFDNDVLFDLPNSTGLQK